MTEEEYKAKLESLDEDGSDKASIYDELNSDYASQISAVTDAMNKLADAQKKIAEITETNTKLIEKIKYQEDSTDNNDNVEENDDTISIEDLF